MDQARHAPSTLFDGNCRQSTAPTRTQPTSQHQVCESDPSLIDDVTTVSTTTLGARQILVAIGVTHKKKNHCSQLANQARDEELNFWHDARSEMKDFKVDEFNNDEFHCKIMCRSAYMP
eukprot:Mrub_01912.p4 GENE.Mrub_01912~~Mrub_01912.p4  ORF type:complete len:119 (-),score=21.45 Mrub_01912:1421-1777(-)